jgi:hypothetical protein
VIAARAGPGIARASMDGSRGYRERNGAKPVLIASGRHRFGAATIGVKPTAAGRQHLRRAKRVRLTAKGSFSPREPQRSRRRGGFTIRR